MLLDQDGPGQAERGLGIGEDADDAATGRWRTQKYEVRVGDAPNADWFAISDFLDRVAEVQD